VVIGTILSAVPGVCSEVVGVLEGEIKEMARKRKLDEKQKTRPRKPSARQIPLRWRLPTWPTCNS